MLVSATFHEHYETVNWCCQFTVNFAIFQEVYHDFCTLYDRDFSKSSPNHQHHKISKLTLYKSHNLNSTKRQMPGASFNT